jgi:hypothetical protein
MALRAVAELSRGRVSATDLLGNEDRHELGAPTEIAWRVNELDLEFFGRR